MKDPHAPSGRPSVDPEVFFELWLVMFFEDIRGERLLMRIAADLMLEGIVTQAVDGGYGIVPFVLPVREGWVASGSGGY